MLKSIYRKSFILFVFFTLNLLQIINANEIIILKSKNSVNYNKVIDGFKSISKDEIKIFELNENINLGKNILLKKNLLLNKHRILALGPSATYAANETLQKIPILFCMITNSERKKIVKHSNLTGILNDIPIKNQLDIIKLASNNFKKIGIIYNSKSDHKHLVDEAISYSKNLGMEIISLKVKDEKEILNSLGEIIQKIDILLIIPDDKIISEDSIKLIIVFSQRNNIPVMAFSENDVKGGALMAIEPDYDYIGKQAAEILNNLNTEKKIEFLYPEKFKIILNLEMAKNLGINISPEILKIVSIIY